MFIDTFGTHVMHGADFGGEWGEISRFSASSWDSMLEANLDVDSAARWSGMLNANENTVFNGQSSRETNLSDVAKFQDEAKDQKFFTKGGAFVANQTLWTRTIWNGPMPILYYLSPLDNLLHPSHFPDLGSAPEKLQVLTEQRKSLSMALSSHCDRLERVGLVPRCDAAPPEDEIAPKIQSQWRPWLTHLRPYGWYQTHECPTGSYVKALAFRANSDFDLTDLSMACFTPGELEVGSFTFTNLNRGLWSSSLRCLNGFSSIQAMDDGTRMKNVRMSCLDAEYPSFNATGSKGTWNFIDSCPESAPVFSGFEILWSGFWHRGIANIRAKCSNDNYNLQTSSQLET
jgi:hypothetical protein